MENAAQYIVLFIYASLLLVAIIFAVVTYILLGKQRERNYQMQLQEAQRKLEAESMKVRLEIQEEGYNTFSKEIHDNIGQVLSSVSLALQSVNQSNLEERQIHVINQSYARINQVTGDLRDLSHALHGKHVEKQGLIVSMEKEISFLHSNNILLASFNCSIESQLPIFSGSQTLLIFRIAQEAIHNVTRHAKATKLEVRLGYTPDDRIFSMEIEDNGKGFRPEATSGMGIPSMQERAKLLNGVLQIRSKESSGTQITLSLKL